MIEEMATRGTRSTSAKDDNGSNVLTTAVKQANWPTVILVLLTGGGNWLAIQNNSQGRQYQIDRALEQIRELHTNLQDFENWQRSNVEKASIALANQTKMLQNQGTGIDSLKDISTAEQQILAKLAGPARSDVIANQQKIMETQDRIWRKLQNWKNPQYHEEQ